MAIKILEKSNLVIKCETCGCKFSFDKEDTYAVGVGALNRAVDCPMCKSRIVYHKVI